MRRVLLFVLVYILLPPLIAPAQINTPPYTLSENAYADQPPLTEKDINIFINNPGLPAELATAPADKAAQIVSDKTGLTLTRYRYILAKVPMAYQVLSEVKDEKSREEVFAMMPKSLIPTPAEKDLINMRRVDIKKALESIDKDLSGKE